MSETIRYKTYPAYKPSGIEWLGDVPEHWNNVKFKFILTCNKGKMPDELSESELDGMLPYLSMEYLRGGESNIKYAYKRSKQVEVDDNDILLLWDGSNAGEFILGKKGVLSSTTAKLTITSDTDKRFLYYSVKGFEPILKDNTNGMGIPHVDGEFFVNSILSLPNITEQQSIAVFLDTKTTLIDDLIAKKVRQIELLKEKRTALINRAVTKGLNSDVPMKDSGIEWFGKVPSGWSVKPLKYLLRNIKAGPFGSALTKDMYVSKGYRVYGQEQVIPCDFTIGDYYIDQEKYDELQQYRVSAGDILVSCVGTFGKIAIVPESAEQGIINPRLIRLRCHECVLPNFLTTVLRSTVVFEQLSMLSRGGTMDVINIGTLSDIVIALPPISEQNKIFDYLNQATKDMDQMVSLIKQHIDKLREYRQTLITSAVTGKIDVRDITSS